MAHLEKAKDVLQAGHQELDTAYFRRSGHSKLQAFAEATFAND